MIGERESERCYFCGGQLQSAVTIMPFVVGNSVVIVKEVPAEVCNQCGEAIVSSGVAAIIDRKVKQARQAGFEVTVVVYSETELVPA